ncbi:MAG: hypothetical protein OEY49_20160 [Candidatus Heimdallarchaeota archaeon]|nr:hypothetical protein [Candidatus Heimdallarchaeota archaeon]
MKDSIYQDQNLNIMASGISQRTFFHIMAIAGLGLFIGLLLLIAFPLGYLNKTISEGPGFLSYYLFWIELIILVYVMIDIIVKPWKVLHFEQEKEIKIAFLTIQSNLNITPIMFKEIIDNIEVNGFKIMYNSKISSPILRNNLYNWSVDLSKPISLKYLQVNNLNYNDTLIEFVLTCNSNGKKFYPRWLYFQLTKLHEQNK